MKFLPFENYTIVSPMQPEEVMRKLAAVVSITGTMGALSYSTEQKAYRGKLSEYGFEMSRIIRYRNSFLPLITGEVAGSIGSSGSEIRIRMRMHKAVIIFCCVWIGGVALTSIASILAGINAGKFSAPALIPFAMLVFVYALVTGGFKYESIKSKKFLNELFNAADDYQYA